MSNEPKRKTASARGLMGRSCRPGSNTSDGGSGWVSIQISNRQQFSQLSSHGVTGMYNSWQPTRQYAALHFVQIVPADDDVRQLNRSGIGHRLYDFVQIAGWHRWQRRPCLCTTVKLRLLVQLLSWREWSWWSWRLRRSCYSDSWRWSALTSLSPAATRTLHLAIPVAVRAP